MKPYKNAAKNEKLRKAVKKFRAEWNAGKRWGMSHMGRPEFTDALMSACGVTHGMAAKACWILRGDGERDILAEKIFGWNKHTA